MRKKRFIPLAIVGLVILAFSFAGDRFPSQLPKGLFYRGQPIPDAVLAFFAEQSMYHQVKEIDIPATIALYTRELARQKSCNEMDEDESLWRFPNLALRCIGTIKNLYVLRVHTHEEGYRQTGVFILKREGDILKITDSIYDYTKYGLHIADEGCEIKENTIVFSYELPIIDFIDQALILYPELVPEYDRSSRKVLPLSSGVMQRCAATVSKEGKIQEIAQLCMHGQSDLKAHALCLIDDAE